MKQFIRGMGVGIFLSALVLFFVYMTVGNKLSDDEIRKRAKRLGMVEEETRVVVDKKDSTGDALQAEITQEALQDAGQPVSGEGVLDVPVEGQSQPNVPAQPVTIIIEGGDDGIHVSRMLQNKGVVDDAGAFSRYLSENQLQGRIRVGTFELTPGMDYASIAEIITH